MEVGVMEREEKSAWLASTALLTNVYSKEARRDQQSEVLYDIWPCHVW